MRYLAVLTVVLSVCSVSAVDVAQAQATDPPKQATSPAAPLTPDLVDGEVRKVDKDAKKITLKNADIPNLEMPAMTMVFQVKDPTMLDTVKVGDKVRFKAQKTGGAFVVTELQSAK